MYSESGNELNYFFLVSDRPGPGRSGSIFVFTPETPALALNGLVSPTDYYMILKYDDMV